MAADLPYVLFQGPYRSVDLPAIYGEVHFCWAIDYYEQGQNSAWLLPNRLYEGLLNGAVPIALAEVETGQWLIRRKVGMVLNEPLDQRLGDALAGLSDDRYRELAGAVGALPRAELATDEAECRELVNALCAP
jgi:hypothetical protein